MDMITLQTKEQLDIFMNPQRQRLLRIMDRSAAPRTPKDLSLELGVSPSSVQHHLKKLESIGLVCLDHTADIHGITARYYAAVKAIIHIGAEEDDSLSDARGLALKMVVEGVLDDAVTDLLGPASGGHTGDVVTGVAHISPEQRAELQKMIRRFIEENSIPSDGTEPWEFALTYHRAEDRK